MHPIIDIIFGKWRGEPNGSLTAWFYLKHWHGVVGPEHVQKEQCMTLDCISIEEVEGYAAELKAEIDACVEKARRRFAKEKHKTVLHAV